MADPLRLIPSFAPDLVELLETVPDGLRDRAAYAIFSAAAAQLALLVGPQVAAGAAYTLADHMATQGLPREGADA